MLRFDSVTENGQHGVTICARMGYVSMYVPVVLMCARVRLWVRAGKWMWVTRLDCLEGLQLSERVPMYEHLRTSSPEILYVLANAAAYRQENTPRVQNSSVPRLPFFPCSFTPRVKNSGYVGCAS
jgi:hypothetical protein